MVYGPMVHSSLVGVLLNFHLHHIALTTDVSRMYSAVLLPLNDHDLHRFVWIRQPTEVLQDYRIPT